MVLRVSHAVIPRDSFIFPLIYDLFFLELKGIFVTKETYSKHDSK